MLSSGLDRDGPLNKTEELFFNTDPSNKAE